MWAAMPINLPHLSPRSRLFARFVNLYPQLLGAGIRVTHVSADGSTIQARLGLNFLNRNLVGTQFGGSLYALCDPWFMIILMQQLGGDYIVWDKAALIRFLRPGRTSVSATFHIPPESVADIRARADQGERVEPVFSVDVTDAIGQVVAQVEKRLYVRRKQPKEN